MMPVLERIRADPFVHWIALLAAVAGGIALATVHWLGLVAGGALVGLVATSLRRALLAGLGFGVVTLLVWMTRLAIEGSLAAVLATGEFVTIAVGVGILAPVLGSLIRGLI